jgi:hypothetical protein
MVGLTFFIKEGIRTWLKCLLVRGNFGYPCNRGVNPYRKEVISMFFDDFSEFFLLKYSDVDDITQTLTFPSGEYGENELLDYLETLLKENVTSDLEVVKVRIVETYDVQVRLSKKTRAIDNGDGTGSLKGKLVGMGL